MLLIIHNLPKDVRAMDVKQLIQEQCGLREIILDNLTDEFNGKRVTVGLAEEADAAILTRKMNGMQYKNCTLYVEDVRGKKFIQPNPPPIPAGLQPPLRLPLTQYPIQMQQSDMMAMNYSNMPFYMTNNSSTLVNPCKNTDSQSNSKQTYDQPAYQALNDWAYPINALYQNKTQGPSNVTLNYESYQNNRETHSANNNRNNWRDSRSPQPKRHESFGNFSDRKSRSNDREGWERYGDVRSDRDRKDVRSRDGRSFDRSKRLSRSNPRDRDDYERKTDSEFAYHQRKRQRERGNDQREFTDHETRRNKNGRNQNREVTATRFTSGSRSTFTRSNKSTPLNATTIGCGQSDKTQFNQPQHIQPLMLNYPPAKRPRLNSNLVSVPTKKVTPRSKPNVPAEVSSERMLMRYKNWRSQSASLLAKKIIKIGSTSKLENFVFKAVLKKLRECIDSRLDVIMGDRIANTLDEILHSYRSKFTVQNDGPFFKSVLEKVEREIREDGKELDGSTKLVHSQETASPNQHQSEPVSEIQRLPKYPQADKREVKKLKKNEILEHQEDFYKMEPILQMAVDDEIDQLVQCYINACEPSNDEQEEMVRNKLLTNTVNEFKKVVKLQVTKRVLDITEGLCVGIFVPKLPQKNLLDAFLKRHGVVSFKKSPNSKMYIAHCDSYQNYDRLLTLKSATLGNNVLIQIKPMNLIGWSEKTNKGKEKSVKAEADNETRETDFTDFNENLDDSDIMFIENKPDVIVVHDESFNIGQSNDQEIEDLQTNADDSDDSQNALLIDTADEDLNEDNENVHHLPANEGVDEDNENVHHLPANEGVDKGKEGETEREKSLAVSDNNEVRKSIEEKDPILSDNQDKDNQQNDIAETTDCNIGNDQTEINDSTENPNNELLLSAEADNSNSEITNVGSNSNIGPEVEEVSDEFDSSSIDDILDVVDGIDDDDLEDF